MLEAENFDPWVIGVGGLSHARRLTPTTTTRSGPPIRRPTVLRDVGQAHADRRPSRLASARRRRRRSPTSSWSTCSPTSAPAARTPRARSRSPSGRRSASIADVTDAIRRAALGVARRLFIRARQSQVSRWPTSRLIPERAKRPIRDATAWERLKANRNWLGFWFMLPAAAIPASVSRLSARARHLAVVHRRADRPRRRVHRARELRVAVGRLDLLALGVQHAALHDRRQRHQIRDRALSRAAAEPAHAVQGA